MVRRRNLNGHKHVLEGNVIALQSLQQPIVKFFNPLILHRNNDYKAMIDFKDCMCDHNFIFFLFTQNDFFSTPRNKVLHIV